ncbi:hypothetical protein GCM10020220_005320 [Nonomuraea rubra]
MLVRQPPAPLERHPERVELLAGPARAHAEDERPPLNRSRFAAMRAMRRGWRYGTMRTEVPSLIRSVTPASHESVVNGS